ncbi:MAG TPA: outer membrane channel [Candidatus Omnitrophica bacterium]|nr:outer membrane channel [Candidatus Omnitrophota bacterium]
MKRIFYLLALGILICAGSVFASDVHHGPVKTCSVAQDGMESQEVFNVGGQIRLRADFARNMDLGDFTFAPGVRQEQGVFRNRLNVLFKPADIFESFVEGQFYNRQGQSDYSQSNLYQAYFEFSTKSPVPVKLKAGRQALCYGSAFFLGDNDFYEGLVWDGVKANIAPSDGLWLDLIAARYVDLARNTSYPEPALYGLYSSSRLKSDIDLDLYFFYHKGGFSFFHADQPDDAEWFTLGARLAGKAAEKFDYEIEPLYQFGKIDNLGRAEADAISAYGGHFEAGYSFGSKYNLRVFAGYAFGSGDNDASDKKYREFHGNIYNDNYVVGDTGLIPDLSGVDAGGLRASGMHIGLAGVSADVTERLNLNLDYHYFVADKTPAGISRDIGSEVNFIAEYKLSEDLSVILSANRFFTAGFFKDASGSGKDVDYFYVQAQFGF